MCNDILRHDRREDGEMTFPTIVVHSPVKTLGSCWEMPVAPSRGRNRTCEAPRTAGSPCYDEVDGQLVAPTAAVGTPEAEPTCYEHAGSCWSTHCHLDSGQEAVSPSSDEGGQKELYSIRQGSTMIWASRRYHDKDGSPCSRATHHVCRPGSSHG